MGGKGAPKMAEEVTKTKVRLDNERRCLPSYTYSALFILGLIMRQKIYAHIPHWTAWICIRMTEPSSSTYTTPFPMRSLMITWTPSHNNAWAFRACKNRLNFTSKMFYFLGFLFPFPFERDFNIFCVFLSTMSSPLFFFNSASFLASLSPASVPFTGSPFEMVACFPFSSRSPIISYNCYNWIVSIFKFEF